MSIKTVKKLIKYEIKRFCKKNKLDGDSLVIDIEGETQINVHSDWLHFSETRIRNQKTIIEVKKKLSLVKLKYLATLFYIQKLLEDF